MSVRFEVDAKEIEALEKKIAKLPNRMEREVNEVLHTDGIKIVADEVTKDLPISSWKGTIRPKNHAKHSKWWKSEKDNLGFTVKTKGGAANKPGSFGYLVFPDEGRGPFNPVEQRFSERGLKLATPKIMDKLSERIDKVLKEEL